MGVPYVIVKNKARLGTVVHKKTAAVLTIADVRSEDNSELAKLVSAAKANFTDSECSLIMLLWAIVKIVSTEYDESRRTWG